MKDIDRREFLKALKAVGLIGGIIGSCVAYSEIREADRRKKAAWLNETRKREAAERERIEEKKRREFRARPSGWDFYELFLFRYVPKSHRLEMEMKRAPDGTLAYLDSTVFPNFQKEWISGEDRFYIYSWDPTPDPAFVVEHGNRRLREKNGKWYIDAVYASKNITICNPTKRGMSLFIDFIDSKDISARGITGEWGFSIALSYINKKTRYVHPHIQNAPDSIKIQKYDKEFQPPVSGFQKEDIIRIHGGYKDHDAMLNTFVHNRSNPYPGWNQDTRSYRRNIERLQPAGEIFSEDLKYFEGSKSEERMLMFFERNAY